MNKLNSYYSNENSKLFDFFNETNKAIFNPFVFYDVTTVIFKKLQNLIKKKYIYVLFFLRANTFVRLF